MLSIGLPLLAASGRRGQLCSGGDLAYHQALRHWRAFPFLQYNPPMRAAARRYLPLALSALLVSTAGLALSGVATAQEPAEQLLQQGAGPYQITVSAKPPAPVAGLGTRITIEVLSFPAGEPAGDAEVLLVMRNPEGAERSRVTVPRVPTSPQLFEILRELDEAGIWSFTVVVDGPAGQGTVDGFIEAHEGPSAGRAGTLAWGVAMAVLVVGGLLAWRALRGHPQPR